LGKNAIREKKNLQHGGGGRRFRGMEEERLETHHESSTKPQRAGAGKA